MIGNKNIKSEAPDLGLDADHILDEAAASQGAPLAVVVNSAHVGAELIGWHKGGAIQLRKPATAYVDFTPALAKCALTSRRSTQMLWPIVCTHWLASVRASSSMHSPRGI